MSKYRIAIGYSRWRTRCRGAGFIGLCCFSVVSLPEAVWGWVAYYHVLLVLALLIWPLVLMCVDKPKQVQDIYTLSGNGEIRAVAISCEDKNTPAWRLHHTSKLLPWGLVLNVHNVSKKYFQQHSFQQSYEHLRWVLKGECREADYRRLCRAIIQAQGTSQTRNNIDVS